VLNGPPKIDYLHMVDIKNQKWRDKHGVSCEDAERRLDAAFDIIERAGGLIPVVFHADAGHFRTEFEKVKFRVRTEGGISFQRFEPDYTCFLHYAMRVLDLVRRTYKDAEKVDFVIEQNKRISKTIRRFGEPLKRVLTSLDADLGRLVGQIIDGDKDRVPLQAADLLVWHTQASKTGKLSVADSQRYEKLTGRLGTLREFTKEEISEFAQRANHAVILDADDSSRA
jgi:hypothetical protein